jgi:hypothetical protein
VQFHSIDVSSFPPIIYIGEFTNHCNVWFRVQVLRKYNIEVQITDEELSAIAIQNHAMFDERRAAAAASRAEP